LVDVYQNKFHFADFNRHLDFDCHRCIRLLGRLGYLKAVQEGKDKRITGFVRTPAWPPPQKFFQSGAIGVAHYIQKWFRFKLQEWIVCRMREVESKEGFYSLEGWLEYRTRKISREESFSDHNYVREQVPSLMGEYQDATGAYLTADVSMIEKPLDISRITLEWVHSTEDLLFKNLSKEDRYLLYLIYARNMAGILKKKFIAPPRPHGRLQNRWRRPWTARIVWLINLPPCKTPRAGYRAASECLPKGHTAADLVNRDPLGS